MNRDLEVIVAKYAWYDKPDVMVKKFNGNNRELKSYYNSYVLDPYEFSNVDFTKFKNLKNIKDEKFLHGKLVSVICDAGFCHRNLTLPNLHTLEYHWCCKKEFDINNPRLCDVPDSFYNVSIFDMVLSDFRIAIHPNLHTIRWVCDIPFIHLFNDTKQILWMRIVEMKSKNKDFKNFNKSLLISDGSNKINVCINGINIECIFPIDKVKYIAAVKIEYDGYDDYEKIIKLRIIILSFRSREIVIRYAV